MNGNFSVWSRQLLAITRVETRRMLFSFRTVPVYMLAALPVGIGVFTVIVTLFLGPDSASPLEVEAIFSTAFGFIVLFPLFFGCVWLFVNLVRGEMVDRSLHYYFLAPIRREMLVAGKYVAGVLVSSSIFIVATVLTFVLLHVPLGLSLASSELFAGGGALQMFKYAAVVALGCAGYGALFLTVGLFFKNPIVPALAIWSWEMIGYVLPPALQKISVVHHLSAIRPIEFDQGGGLIVVISDPPSVLSAVVGITFVSLALLTLASWRARRLEIDYAAE